MTFDISSIRLKTQLLTNPKFTSAKQIVSYFGAMQAQDYPMSKWAVGVRLSDATESSIEKALDKGDIIRTHVLRPTWHLVAAEDIHWMLELTGDNVFRQMNSSNKQLGLDDTVFAKSRDIIAKALEGGNHLIREELMEILNHSGIKTHSYRSLHIMLDAEVKGLVCNGARKGRNHSYALLDERVKKSKHFTKEEALAELAKRYFTSHGPATLKDFGWWSGLSVADTKLAVELNNKTLDKYEIGGQTYWSADFDNVTESETFFMLPAFDEFLIAYKDRSVSIHIDHSKHAFTSNGIFRPIIVWNGQVVGTWKRTVKNDKVAIEPNFLHKAPSAIHKLFEKEAKRFADFLQKEVLK